MKCLFMQMTNLYFCLIHIRLSLSLGMTAISSCLRLGHGVVSSLLGWVKSHILGAPVDLRPGSLPPPLPVSLLSLSSYRSRVNPMVGQ